MESRYLENIPNAIGYALGVEENKIMSLKFGKDSSVGIARIPPSSPFHIDEGNSFSI